MAGMFEKFLAELTKTLGGGPGKEGRGDVGAFERDAIAGGQRVLGLAPEAPIDTSMDQGPSLSAAEHLSDVRPTPDDINRFFGTVPDKVNAIDLNKDYQLQQNPMPAPDKMLPLPVPQADVLSPPTQASIPQKTSRAKHKSDALTAAASEQQTTASAPASDPIADLLKENETKFGADRDKANQAALDAGKLTDEEKVATALLAALPGLFGLVGGAAIGGGGGAMAGLAGGLSGGATGIQGIAADKKEKRKEALAQAAKAEDRLMHVGDQKLGHAEGLQKQNFEAGQNEKKFGQQRDLTKMELDARAKEGSLNRANATQLKRMDLFGDIQKAQIAAGGKGGKLTEQQERTATLLPTMLQANNTAMSMEQNLSNLPQASGVKNALNSVAPESMESDEFKAYQDAGMAYTGSYLFKVSGAAVPPDEIKRYSRVLFARPGDTPQMIQAKQQMRENINAVLQGTLHSSPAEIQAALEKAGVPPALTRIAPGGVGAAAQDPWAAGRPR